MGCNHLSLPMIPSSGTTLLMRAFGFAHNVHNIPQELCTLFALCCLLLCFGSGLFNLCPSGLPQRWWSRSDYYGPVRTGGWSIQNKAIIVSHSLFHLNATPMIHYSAIHSHRNVEAHIWWEIYSSRSYLETSRFASLYYACPYRLQIKREIQDHNKKKLIACAVCIFKMFQVIQNGFVFHT